MDKQEIRLTLEAIERLEVNLLKGIESLNTIRAMLGKKPNPASTKKKTISKPEKKTPRKILLKSSSVPTADLGEPPDFNSEEWPEATNPSLIVTDDSEKKFRAMQIVASLECDFTGKSILDCGCGDGHVTYELSKTAKNVAGYDISKNDRWSSFNDNNFLFSDKKSVIEKYAIENPFDIVILNDVLDHVIGEDPTDLLLWVSKILKKDGIAHVRLHPWTSRHGGHLYEQVNRAFLHLAMTPDELMKNGIKLEHNQKVSRPIAVYEKWFSQSGFSFDDRNIKTDKVDDYFSGELLDRIIKVTWGDDIDRDTALKIMANSLIDYTLHVK